eukprot:m.106093 g.106093  ORF g.106093 m.106093 type:complete len:581 (-) comp8936_c0_seq5:1961-3703(-)
MEASPVSEEDSGLLSPPGSSKPTRKLSKRGASSSAPTAESSTPSQDRESPFHKFAVLQETTARPTRLPSAAAPGTKKPLETFPCFLDSNKLAKRKTYMTLVKVLQTRVGGEAEAMAPEALSFAETALAVDAASRTKWTEDAQDAQHAPAAQQVRLHVELLSAASIAAKDASGTSDPYCTLELVFSGKPSTLRHHQLRAEPSKTIRMSKIVYATLNPTWNEVFEFDLPVNSSMELHLDMWDHDERPFGEGAGTSKIKSIGKKAKGWVLRHTDTDDYLGYVIVPVSTIPAGGMVKEYALLPRSSRSHVSGTVKLSFKLLSGAVPTPPRMSSPAAGTDDKDGGTRASWATLCNYQGLFEACLRADPRTRAAAGSGELWDGVLSPLTKNLLYHFAILNGMTSFQQDLIRWIVYCELYLWCGMSAGPLLDTFKAIRAAVDESRDEMAGEEQTSLLASFDDMMRSVLKTVATLHTALPFMDVGARQLEALVKIASGIAGTQSASRQAGPVAADQGQGLPAQRRHARCAARLHRRRICAPARRCARPRRRPRAARHDCNALGDFIRSRCAGLCLPHGICASRHRRLC